MTWLARAHALALVAALVAAPGPARAHPHVYIEYSVTVLVIPAGVEGVQLTWTFDEASRRDFRTIHRQARRTLMRGRGVAAALRPGLVALAGARTRRP